jgi:anti-sigma B factor antagonist
MAEASGKDANQFGSLRTRTQDLGGCTLIHLAGEIDLANAPKLEVQLCTLAEQGSVVVDLTEVDFLDSTALSAMVVAYHRAHALGNTIRLAGAHGSVKRLLEVTRLDAHFDHQSDVAGVVEQVLTTSPPPDQ